VIENVAASVADGARVDWDRAGAQVAGRELRLVRHLRLIDSVAEVYRTLPPLAEDDGSGANARPDYPEGPRWGRLILLDRIGRGSSADVFRAWDAELQREVALKLLHEHGESGTSSANARLLQEARRIARIHHAHVAHVYGAEKHEGRIGLWMELVRGRSLDAIVREDGPLPIAEAAHIGIDVCSALASVHGAGILHRDVKAQNVLREDNGRTVLMDFGTGEEMTDGKPRLAGTPIYLAPEIMKHRPASVQSDLYSVGVLLFYLVTGEFPVTGESIDGLEQAHREGRLRSVRDVREDVPPAVARVVDRALAPEPSKRYASASAMEAALRHALDAMTVRPTSGRNRWLLPATTAVAVLALIGSVAGGRLRPPVTTGDPTSIAVLPLRFVSGEAQAPYLAEGLTDQLITTLGQVGSLKVTAHTSVAPFKNGDVPVSTIAQQLGVGSVVEGTVAVQKSTGNDPPSVRVNVHLIRAGTDIEMWSSSFERRLGDLLALEADIARAVARQVRAVLTPDEKTRFSQSHSTSPEAERAYLEGRAQLADYGVDRTRRALDAFTTAVRQDPNHAAAHAGAARSYIALGFDGILTQPAARVSALAATTRALELDETLADAHVALADLKFYYDWDWPGADREYRRALDLNPSLGYTLTQYARYLAAANRLSDAVNIATEAANLDPLSAEAAQTRALIQMYARDFGGAVTTLNATLAASPSHARTHYTLGRVYDAQGRYAEAIAETERAMALAESHGPGYEAQMLRLRAMAGMKDEARKGFAAYQARLAAAGQTITPERAAVVHAALGDHDRALDDLQQCIAQRDPSVLWLQVDPRFDPLRTHPRFPAILKQIVARE
jgi:serine/threonine-protein kinase